MGIWHVASWNFVLWGLYFGIILLIEKYFLLKLFDKIPSFLSRIYAIFLFVYGWVIFAIEDTSRIAGFTASLFGVGGGCDTESLYLLKSFFLLIVIGIVGATPLCARLYHALEKKRPALTFVLTLLLLISGFLLSLVYVTASSYNPFLYFRF